MQQDQICVCCVLCLFAFNCAYFCLFVHIGVFLYFFCISFFRGSTLRGCPLAPVGCPRRTWKGCSEFWRRWGGAACPPRRRSSPPSWPPSAAGPPRGTPAGPPPPLIWRGVRACGGSGLSAWRAVDPGWQVGDPRPLLFVGDPPLSVPVCVCECAVCCKCEYEYTVLAFPCECEYIFLAFAQPDQLWFVSHVK